MLKELQRINFKLHIEYLFVHHLMHDYHGIVVDSQTFSKFASCYESS